MKLKPKHKLVEHFSELEDPRIERSKRHKANALQRLEMGGRQIPMQANPAFSPLLIINSIFGQAFSRLFSTHPSTQYRVERLMQIERSLGA